MVEENGDKDGSVIYQHPQSKVFSKMASLVGFKSPVPALSADPVAVLDRKLDQEDRRMKKDNKRWRTVICLTVAVCLVIFCLVLAQVISSVVSSSGGPLPNIDVSQKSPASSASPDAPHHEPLVAGMSSAAAGPQKANGRTPGKEVAAGKQEQKEIAVNPGESGEILVTTKGGSPKDDYVLKIAETAGGENYKMSAKKEEGEGSEKEATVMEKALEVAVGIAEAQAQKQAEEQAVEQAEEQAEEQAVERAVEQVVAETVQQAIQQAQEEAPTTARQPQLLLLQRTPFFPPPGMFQGRQQPPSPILVPSPMMTPPRPTLRQPHHLPTRPAFLRPPLLRPALGPSLPPATNQRPPFHPLANHGRPQLAVFLQRAGFPQSFSLQQAASRQQSPLSEGPFGGRVNSVLHDMRQLMSTVSPLLVAEPGFLPSSRSMKRLLDTRGPFMPPRPLPRRPVVSQTRRFPPRPPPAGLRPGPLRPPISVAPPRQSTNQRVWAPRLTNRRPLPPGPLPPPTNQRVLQRHDFLPPRPVASRRQPSLQSAPPSRQFPGQPSQQITLVGNPQYNYPKTATGIQDILRYIQSGYRPPQNGHGAYNRLSNNKNRFSNNGFSSGGGRHGGPIYPPVYNGQRVSPGSSAKNPFRLMLDVHAMENSDRYGRQGARSLGHAALVARSGRADRPTVQPVIFQDARRQQRPGPVIFEGPMVRGARLNPARSGRFEPLMPFMGRPQQSLAIRPIPVNPPVMLTPPQFQQRQTAPRPPHISKVVYHEYPEAGSAPQQQQSARGLLIEPHMPNNQINQAIEPRMLNQITQAIQPMISRPIYQQFPVPQRPTVSKVVFHEYPNAKPGPHQPQGQSVGRMIPVDLQVASQVNRPLAARPVFQQPHAQHGPSVSEAVFHGHPDARPAPQQAQEPPARRPHPVELLMISPAMTGQPMAPNLPLIHPRVSRPSVSKVVFHEYQNARQLPEQVQAQIAAAQAAQTQAQAQAQAQAKAAKAHAQAAQAQAEARARAQAQAQARAQVQAHAQAQAAQAARDQAAQAHARAQAPVNAQSQIQAARAQEAQVQVAQARVRAHVQAQAQAQAQAKAAQDAQAQAQAAEAAQIRAAEAQKVQARVHAEAQAHAQAQTEARARAEAEAKARAHAEAQAHAQAQVEARAKSESQAHARAHAEAQAAQVQAARAHAQAQARAHAVAQSQAQTQAQAPEDAVTREPQSPTHPTPLASKPQPLSQGVTQAHPLRPEGWLPQTEMMAQ